MQNFEYFDKILKEKFVVGMPCQFTIKNFSAKYTSKRLFVLHNRTPCLIGRSNYIYYFVDATGKLIFGYIYYNKKLFKPLPEWKNFSLEEQIFLSFLKNTCKFHYKAIMDLIFSKKFIVLSEFIKSGFTSKKTLNVLTNHDLLIKKKWVGRGNQAIIYEKSQGEDAILEYIKTDYADFRYGHKKEYIKAAYDFQNITVPKLVRLWFGKTAFFATEVYKKGMDGLKYKFDIVAFKKMRFLSHMRQIPIIIEVKNFFVSNSKFDEITYFKYKLDQCYPTGYLAILVCKGAGPKEVYDRAGRMNIWLRDITKDLKKINSPGENIAVKAC